MKLPSDCPGYDPYSVLAPLAGDRVQAERTGLGRRAGRHHIPSVSFTARPQRA